MNVNAWINTFDPYNMHEFKCGTFLVIIDNFCFQDTRIYGVATKYGNTEYWITRKKQFGQAKTVVNCGVVLTLSGLINEILLQKFRLLIQVTSVL